MNQQFERTTIGIDHGVAPFDFAQESLAAHDLFPCVIAARTTRFSGLDALAVDGRR
jgi:hypothetical protein